MRLIEQKRRYGLGVGMVFLSMLMGSSYAQRLTAMDTVTLSNGDIELRYRFDRNIQSPKSFYLKDKNLLVVDFVSTGVNQTLNSKNFNNSVIFDVQNLYANNKVRSTAKLKPNTSYTILNKGNETVVTLSRGSDYSTNQPVWDNTQSGTSVTNLQVNALPAKDVAFYRNSQGAGVIEVFLPNDKTQVQLIDEQKRGVMLSVPGVVWDAGQIRRIEVTDFATPVAALEVVNNNGAAAVRVRTQANYEYSSQQIGNKYQLIIRPNVQNAQIGSVNRGVGVKQYDGDLISINFQDIDVRAILQIIADFTGLNIVVSDSVNSRITIRLQNVPWDQALDVVLRSKGLVQQRSGTVVFIVPRSEAVPEQRDLITEVIQINNAKAPEIATVLRTSNRSTTDDRRQSTGLSQYGELTVDPNQNLLIIRDTPEQMLVIKELITHLDKPLRQVVIQAQIVTTHDNYTRELGIKWGVNSSNRGVWDVASGDNGTIGGTTTGVATPTNPIGGKNNIWGGGQFDGKVGNIGFNILRNSFNASLELRAMQEDGKGEIQSSPTLMTTDRQEAYINQGVEIPYQSTNGDGDINIEFKEVVMELKVTPNITPDDNIIMDIQIKNDTPGAAIQAGDNSNIANNKREIKTQAVVRDGETVVIGGIFTVETSSGVTKVPLLGDIPVIGNAFKTTNTKNNKTEMVIFLTPNIVR